MTSTADEKPNHRRVYAKGFYDGLKAAGQDQYMTPTRFKAAHDSLPTVAKKLFEYIPAQETATVSQIVTSMGRMGASRIDIRTADGVLAKLKDAGLVKEPERGVWQRIVPRERGTLTLNVADGEGASVVPPAGVEVESAECAQLTIAAKPDDQSPTTILGAIAAGLRAKATDLLTVAQEIEDAALMIEGNAQDTQAKLAKLEQFREFLRDI
ncbi:hypothetical protein [Burkholderia anthina]|uniref:hypothetical protein n=1 Tax=Burkholderia anthina TaxID=179879 RepID=UPI001588DF49|nr:hypothetical protein [Burkholderia anthina]